MNQVDILIASLYRDAHCIKTVESLVNQPELNQIYLVCNNYTPEQFAEVFDALKRHKNVIVLRRENQKGCSEKFYPINISQAPYICNCDDDLIYPANFLSVLLAKCKEHKAVVSIHGRIMKTRPIANYYKDKVRVYHSMSLIEQDAEVEVLATCGSMFDRRLMPLCSVLYESVVHKNMSDIYISYMAKQSGLKCIVIAHPGDWVKHKEMKETDCYIYTEARNNCPNQTQFVNEYFR